MPGHPETTPLGTGCAWGGGGSGPEKAPPRSPLLPKLSFRAGVAGRPQVRAPPGRACPPCSAAPQSPRASVPVALSLRPWFPPFKKAPEEGPQCIIGRGVRARGLRVGAGDMWRGGRCFSSAPARDARGLSRSRAPRDAGRV